MRLGIRKFEKGAVRLPNILVLTVQRPRRLKELEEKGIPSGEEANKLEIEQKKMESMFGAPPADDDAGSMW